MPITDPTDIAGLIFWGDAEAANITENPAGKAEIMDNQEGTATEDLSQSISDRRPDITTIFGKAALEFRTLATDESLNGGVLSPVAGTLVWVLRLDPAVSGINAVMWNGTILAGSQSPALWKGSNDLHMKVGRSSLTSVAFNTSPDDDWAWGDDVLLTMTWDGATDAMTLRINKIAKGSGTVSNLNGMVSGHTIAAKNGVEGSDINVYGIVVYNSVLTGTDLTDIEDFMQSTYLPVNVLTADAGPDRTLPADETDTMQFSLVGEDSFGPLPITNYEWKEGSVVLATGPSPTADVSLTTGVHNIVLTVTDSNNDTSTDTVIYTVSAFSHPTIRSFKEITSSTATLHTFNDVFPLTPRLTLLPFTEFHNQLRVFKRDTADVVTELFPVGRPSPAGLTDFTINTAGTQLTLDVALVTSDILLIMRDTLMSKPFVVLTPVALFHAADRNVRGDQILFICQELREIRQIANILGSDVGEPFEYDLDAINVTDWSQTALGDAVETDFSYSNIEMLPPTAVLQDNQLQVFVNGVLQTIVTDYVVNISAVTIDFVSAPADTAAVDIIRVTRIDKRWVDFRDGSTFSSLQDVWDFLNVKFIVQETPGFPTFLLSNALENRIFPRALNLLNYSGPGSRFFFGNLPWFGDGTVFIFKNDLLLIDGIDYTLDFTFFFINLTTALVAADTLQVIPTTPNNAFGALAYGIVGGESNVVGDTAGEVELDDTPQTDKGILTNDATLYLALPTFSNNNGRTLPLKTFLSDNITVACVEFDVSNLDPSDFTTINLILTVVWQWSTILGYSFAIRRCLRVWDMGSLNVSPANGSLSWNRASTAIPWTTPGAKGADTDFDSASALSVSFSGNPPSPILHSEWVSPDLSTMVTAARADDNIFRLMLVPTPPSTGRVELSFASLNNTNPNKAPRLEGFS